MLQLSLKYKYFLYPYKKPLMISANNSQTPSNPNNHFSNLQYVDSHDHNPAIKPKIPQQHVSHMTTEPAIKHKMLQ